MGLFDKMLDVMKLNDDEEFYDEEFDEYEDEVPVKKSFGFLKTGTDDVDSYWKGFETQLFFEDQPYETPAEASQCDGGLCDQAAGLRGCEGYCGDSVGQPYRYFEYGRVGLCLGAALD